MIVTILLHRNNSNTNSANKLVLTHLKMKLPTNYSHTNRI